jgi:hypothetical protein
MELLQLKCSLEPKPDKVNILGGAVHAQMRASGTCHTLQGPATHVQRRLQKTFAAQQVRSAPTNHALRLCCSQDAGRAALTHLVQAQMDQKGAATISQVWRSRHRAAASLQSGGLHSSCQSGSSRGPLLGPSSMSARWRCPSSLCRTSASSWLGMKSPKITRWCVRQPPRLGGTPDYLNRGCVDDMLHPPHTL